MPVIPAFLILTFDHLSTYEGKTTDLRDNSVFYPLSLGEQGENGRHFF